MRRSLVLLLALATVACEKSSAPKALAKNEAAAQPAASTSSAEAPAPAGHPLKGKVIKRIDAAPYSYLKLATATGEVVWAAVPQTTAAKGVEVTLADAFPMRNFESKTLKRKFDVVYFGTLSEPNVGARAAAGAIPPGHASVSGDAAKMAEQHRAAAAGPRDVKEVKVEKASGPDARTIAEIYAQRTDLKEKPVTVRGQVVKFNAGIMGRNWVHLRDGTGSVAKSDNDITVTTNDHVAVGDVVTAKGTVRIDKDFGAGYTYPVIIEDARVSQ